MIVGKDGNVQLVNPAAVIMLGRRKDDMLGISYLSIIKLVDQEGQAVGEGLNPIAMAFKTRKAAESKDLELVSAASGRRLPVKITVIPIENGGIVITLRNIEQELKEENERSDFISTASHEMRTPVASIEGYLGLALNPQTATIDERAQGYLTKAHEASQHLGHLFADLLDVTKLDDGKMRPHTQPVEMTELVKRIADGQAPNIIAKGLRYVFNSSARSSGAARIVSQLIYADVDPDFVREALDNMIENAIKYTPQGSISVNVRGGEDSVIVSVADTGIGIAPEDLVHIFQKFYRVDNSDTRTIGGTGLGLYLVKQRVEAIGGKVWAESQVGRGTTFFISLPRISADEYEKRRIAFVNNQNVVK